mgnify:CR=1 FL=1
MSTQTWEHATLAVSDDRCRPGDVDPIERISNLFSDSVQAMTRAAEIQPAAITSAADCIVSSLLGGGGVGTVAALGIIAAIALPAYQDYSERAATGTEASYLQ